MLRQPLLDLRDRAAVQAVQRRCHKGSALCVRAPDPCRNLGDLVAAYRDEFVVAHLQHDHPVPACRPREGTAMRPAAGNPDRDSRPLHRAGQEYGPVDAVVRSCMVYRFSGEQAVDDLQALIEPLGQDPGLVGSPNVPYSASTGVPSPTPRIARPRESRSSVVTSRASFHGRRRGKGVIAVPILIRVVASESRR